LLNVVKSSHSSTCLPENVCKFLFHCNAYAYMDLVSIIAGRRLIRLQRMTDMHHHYFSKWTTTFCSFSENVSPNDGMLSIFVSYPFLLNKIIILLTRDIEFIIAE
ncbi:hypothetical protein T4C_2525, partial [Trichinella pseudospiralis]